MSSSQGLAKTTAPARPRPATANTSTKNTTVQAETGSETVPQPTPQERRINAITHVIDALDSHSIPYGIDGDMAWRLRGMQNHKVQSVKINAVATGAKIRLIFAGDNRYGTIHSVGVKLLDDLPWGLTQTLV